MQPSAIALLAGVEAVSALLGIEGGSAGITPDEAKPSAADPTPLGCAVAKTLGTIAHLYLRGLASVVLGARRQFAVALRAHVKHPFRIVVAR